MFTREDHRFYLGDVKNPEAEIAFVDKGDNTWSINSTYVNPSLRGQGMAEKLMDAVADRARQEGKKLAATCSYAKKQLDTNDKYADLVR